MEQIARDARIATIYEGTTGIQALDLLGRKVLIMTRGGAVREFTTLVGKFAVDNMRNPKMRSFATTLETTFSLLPRIPAGRLVVTESGIGTRDDVERMLAAGVRRFLVGESLMRQPSPGDALRGLSG